MRRILILISLLVLPACSHAATVEETVKHVRAHGLVTDDANILSAEEEAKLTARLKAWNDETSNEFAIVTVDKLGGLDAQQFSLQLITQLGVGKKGRDNGLLLLIAPNDRKYFMQVGKGLEGKLPDGKVGDMLRTTLPGHFRSKHYYAGIDAAVTKTMAAAAGEFQALEPAGVPWWVIVLIVVIVLLAVLVIGFIISQSGGGTGSSDFFPQADQGAVPPRPAAPRASGLAAGALGAGALAAAGERLRRKQQEAKAKRKDDDDDAPTTFGSTFGGGDSGGGGGSSDSGGSSSFDFGGGDSGGGGAGGDW